jgi:hypothetical protein
MAGFVQIIEWRTSRLDEVQALQDEWRQDHPDTGPRHIMVGADRDDDGRYLTIVEFPSYEEAMANSSDPRTAEFAQKMMALCDGPPTFTNLDLIHEQTKV